MPESEREGDRQEQREREIDTTLLKEASSFFCVNIGCVKKQQMANRWRAYGQPSSTLIFKINKYLSVA